MLSVSQNFPPPPAAFDEDAVAELDIALELFDPLAPLPPLEVPPEPAAPFPPLAPLPPLADVVFALGNEPPAGPFEVNTSPPAPSGPPPLAPPTFVPAAQPTDATRMPARAQEVGFMFTLKSRRYHVSQQRRGAQRHPPQTGQPAQSKALQLWCHGNPGDGRRCFEH